MSKFLANVFLICLSVLLQILVMQYGWGLSPRSWWWIIGGGVFGYTVLLALRLALNSEDSKKS